MDRKDFHNSDKVYQKGVTFFLLMVGSMKLSKIKIKNCSDLLN